MGDFEPDFESLMEDLEPIAAVEQVQAIESDIQRNNQIQQILIPVQPDQVPPPQDTQRAEQEQNDEASKAEQIRRQDDARLERDREADRERSAREQEAYLDRRAEQNRQDYLAQLAEQEYDDDLVAEREAEKEQEEEKDLEADREAELEADLEADREADREPQPIEEEKPETPVVLEADPSPKSELPPEQAPKPDLLSEATPPADVKPEADAKPDAERRAERESNPEQERLTALYKAEAGTDEHRQLEQDYNQLRRERMGQAPEDYKFQRDTRHEFEFKENFDEQGRLAGITARNAKINPDDANDDRRFSLRNPDEVINWRNTEVGGKLDAKARSISKGTGDDAGHLFALQFGADPAKMENISNQNWIQNQAKGTYRDFEKGAVDLARRGARVGMEIDLYRNPDKPDRDTGRVVKTFERDADGREIKGTEGSVSYINPPTSGDRAMDREQQAKVRAERAEAEKLFQDLTPEQRSAWMRRVNKR